MRRKGTVQKQLKLALLALSFALWAGCGRTHLVSESLCGDHSCTSDEDCRTCPEDCGICTQGCGDEICSSDEDCSSCPEDCGFCPGICGNSVCDEEENCVSCPVDCGRCPLGCPDGACSEEEDCSSCPEDCGECPVGCGDGVCGDDENCYDCSEDCGTCPSFCGDGYCDHDETCESCEGDCGECPEGCDDGQCEPLEGETCMVCPMDCKCGDATCQEILSCLYACNWEEECTSSCVETGCYEAQDQAVSLILCILGSCADACEDLSGTRCISCVMMSCPTEAMACYNGTCGPTRCGDGRCQPEEDCTNCPADCGECPETCGDGVCQAYEDCLTCQDDCGPCFWCGDGYCDIGEDCEICPEDCGECPLLCGDGFCLQLLGESCANCPMDCTCGEATCSEILRCISSCRDILCPNQCLESGCHEAQQQAHAVLSCMISNCIFQCFDPSSMECQACLMDSCGGELLACMMGDC